MILYDKLKERYTRKEIIKIFDDTLAGRIWRGDKSVFIHTISNKIDLYNLEYSFDNFQEDYGDKYQHNKEMLMLYQIFMKGYNLNRLSKKYNLESQFRNLLRDGFDYNCSSKNIYLTFELLGIQVDTVPFSIDIYETHVELFGSKGDLENFKEQYALKYDLYYEPYRKSWHLAFNGCLADYIKSKH